MDDDRFEEWCKSLNIIGNEAYLPGEMLDSNHRPKVSWWVKPGTYKTEEERLAARRASSLKHMRKVREQQKRRRHP